MSTPLFEEENEKIIRDYLQDMIDKGIYLILDTEQGGEDSVEVHLKPYRRHVIVLDYLMRGVQYLFSYDGEKYLTDLKDKFDRFYPYRVYWEAALIIHSIICGSAKGIYGEIKRRIEAKFDVSELAEYNYNRLKEVTVYVCKEYDLELTYYGYIVTKKVGQVLPFSKK